jgi:hypothetical protein
MVKKIIKPKKKIKKNVFLDELKENRSYVEDQEVCIISKIVDMCKSRIKISNSSRVTNLIFDVPTFIIGYPLYDIVCIALGVNAELKKLGLKTIYIKPGKIYINW